MKKVTVRDILKMKEEGVPIVMITSYDCYIAKLVDECKVDGILVGDSVGMVLLGYDTTLPVTMEEMLHHVKAVARAKPRALLIADMPFLSYQVSKEQAVRNAGRFIKAGAEAVKLEGGVEVVDKVEAIVKAGIPVMGHIGLTPQKIHQFGGYRLMGKESELAIKLLEDAKALEEAGVFSIVIEFTAMEVAREITRALRVPTICIGSGPYCDGQIIVLNDIIGLSPFIPSFVKKYADVSSIIRGAVSAYVSEVRARKFPGEEHYRRMPEEEYRKFLKRVEELSKSSPTSEG